MRMLITVIIFFTTIFQGIAPEDSHREIRFFRYMGERVREQMIEQRIDKLLRTIRIIESNENYHARGGSGEYGVYQFMSATWDFYCYMYFGERLDIRNSENQDAVARFKVADMVERGYTNEQIAAVWNCGRPDNWELRIGINRWGVKYNTPLYVKKFVWTFDQII